MNNFLIVSLMALFMSLGALAKAEQIDPQKYSNDARAMQAQQIKEVQTTNQKALNKINEQLVDMMADEQKKLKALNNKQKRKTGDFLPKRMGLLKVKKSHFSWGMKEAGYIFRDETIVFDLTKPDAITELNNYYAQKGKEGWTKGLNDQNVKGSKMTLRIRWKK